MQFDAFSYPALDQVINHVAKYRNRSRGRQPMPIVIRIPFAGGYGGAEHHNDSPETYYAHTSGLKVVTPSTAIDAHHLLRAAIAAPGPGILLGPKGRYWSKEEGALDGGGGLPVGRGGVVREGSGCPIPPYGAMVARSLQAASRASAERGTEAC